MIYKSPTKMKFKKLNRKITTNESMQTENKILNWKRSCTNWICFRLLMFLKDIEISKGNNSLLFLENRNNRNASKLFMQRVDTQRGGVTGLSLMNIDANIPNKILEN